MYKCAKNARSEMIGRFFMRAGFIIRLHIIGVLVSLSPLAFADEYQCHAEGDISWRKLDRVVDGDTVRLGSGEKVRVVAINTPELGDEHRPDQAFSRQARQAVIDFFRDTKKVGVKVGVDPKDRYGRLLAQLYRSDGASLAEHLLAMGLAIHILVPPNDAQWQCLAKTEAKARKMALGLWSHPSFYFKSAGNLQMKDSGFQLVKGIVERVDRSKNAYWLTVGKLAVRIRDTDLKYFDVQDITAWRGKEIRLRGWIIDRGNSQSVKKNKFQRLMMNLRHQAMMK